MKPEDFVKQLLPHAYITEQKSGISAIFTLAQAALETGWGNSAPGNMYFGVKWRKSDKCKKQLLRTTEISTKPDLKFPEIISVTPFENKGKQMYRYRVRDWFRAYDSPEESFTDHAQFFIRNKRYTVALEAKVNPVKFAQEVAKAGYATDPDYADKLITTINRVALILQGFIEKDADKPVKEVEGSKPMPEAQKPVETTETDIKRGIWANVLSWIISHLWKW